MSELKKEIEILKGLKSLENVKLFKNSASATKIKWYDGHDDRVVWEPIPIKNGAPTRAPKYVSRDAYWGWGQKYSEVKEIE